MSKLLNTYNNLKKQNSDILYLFKNGAFYLAIEDDARFLSHNFNLKLVNLNSQAVKCGFPCSSFDKYYIMLNKLEKEFKIVDKDTVSDVAVYLENEQVLSLLKQIEEIDLYNLSVSEAFAFIEKIKEKTNKLLGGGK